MKKLIPLIALLIFSLNVDSSSTTQILKLGIQQSVSTDNHEHNNNIKEMIEKFPGCENIYEK